MKYKIKLKGIYLDLKNNIDPETNSKLYVDL